MVTLMLSLSMPLSRLNLLCWSHLDLGGGCIAIPGKNGQPPEQRKITAHTVRLLCAIPRTSTRVFAKPSASAPALQGLLRAVLLLARLPDFSANALVAWSRRQTPQTRLGVATRYCEY